jgi:hypothetical protein
MKAFVASLLILSVFALSGIQSVSPTASAPMTLAQLSSAVGTGFWGGLGCGLAAAGVGIGVAAAITAVTVGTGSPLAIGVGTSLALHVVAVCAML